MSKSVHHNRRRNALQRNRKNKPNSKSEDRKPFFNTLKPAKIRVSAPSDRTELEAEKSAHRVVDRVAKPFLSPAPEIKESPEKAAATPTLKENEESSEQSTAAEAGNGEVDARTNTDNEAEAPSQADTDNQQIQPSQEADDKSSATAQLQRKAEETVQPKANRPGEVNAEIERRLQLSKGRGRLLPVALQTQLGVAFGGHDFSAIRIHTGTEAAKLCSDLNAKAFAHGQDIYFNEGRYNPTSREGLHLLAHELTHTVQNGNAPPASLQLSGSWMEDLLAQLRLANREALQAEDPQPAQAARDQAIQQGLHAQLRAQQTGNEASAPQPPERPRAEPRIAQVKRRAPAPVTPATDAAVKGSVGTDLDAQSADVCNQAAVKTQRLADNEIAHDPAEDKLHQSKSAVQPPENENQSRKQAEQIKQVQGGSDPKVDPQGNRRALNTAIAAAVPKSIEALNEFESKGKGKVVGNEVLGAVKADVSAVQGTYQQIDKVAQAPPPATPEMLPETELAPDTPALDLGKGAVPPLADEHTDFSEFTTQSDELLAQEQIAEERLAMVDSGDLAEAHQERQGLKQKVQESPQAAREFAAAQTGQVQKDMRAEEGKARNTMRSTRQRGLQATQAKQKSTKTALELKREAVTAEIQRRYAAVKSSVTKKLDNLEKKSLQTFDQQQKAFSADFEADVRRRVNLWKKERYSGLFAGVKWLKDKLVGIDHFPKVKAAFNDARIAYVQKIDQLIIDINAANATVIEECREDLRTAKLDVQTYISGLQPALQQTGQTALADMQQGLKALEASIDKRKEELQNKLCEKKDEAIEAIDKKIEAMKAEMSGALGKLGKLLLKAALKFFEWALEKAGLKPQALMDVINKGAVVIKKIVTSPIQFFKNLASAVKAGIGNFVTNIKKHLLNGMMNWLTGQMSDAGITLPAEFNLKGIFSLILQILGLTWTHIRQKLVKKVGERAVAAAEKTVEIVKRVRAEGPIALWHMLKEKAAEIKAAVLAKVRDWIIVQVVKQAVFKLATMLNPVGAVLQAIKAIYDLVMFFVENINRIIQFVKSILSSIAKIAAGAIGAAAAFIENAMAKTVPIILSFLARFFGLSGIGKTVSNIIKTIRKPVDKVVDRAIDFVARPLHKLAGKAKAGAGRAKARVKGAAGQVVAKVRKWWLKKTAFKAGGESHSLFFKSSKLNSPVMMASTPQTVKMFLKDNKPTGSDPELANKYGKAMAQLAKVETARANLSKSIRNGDPTQKAKNTELLAVWTRLKERLAEFMDKLSKTSTIQNTEIDYKGVKQGLGTGATAWPLTIKGKGGSEPSIESDIWNQVKQRQDGNRGYYIRGHLINAKMHGSGSKPENLTPISQQANRDHNTNVEERVKNVVWNRSDKKSDGKKHIAVRYEVKAVYDKTNRPTLEAMKKQIAKATDDTDRQNDLTRVVENEQKLPSKLVNSAESVDEEKGKQITTKIPLGNDGVVHNVIPATVPQLQGEPQKTLVRLSLSAPGADGVNAVKALSMVKGIDKRLANAILAALAADKTPFASWVDFQSRVKGIGPKTLAILQAQPKVSYRGKTEFK